MKHPGDAVFEPSSPEQIELAAECEQRRRMDNATQPSAHNEPAVVKYNGPKHTPGPWLSDAYWVWADANVKANIVCVCPLYAGASESQAFWGANRRLITAAPDMLAALHVAQAMIDPENHPPQFSTGEALKIINAAIAKATSTERA